MVADYFLQLNSNIQTIWLLHSEANALQAGTDKQAKNLETLLRKLWEGKHQSLRFPLEKVSLSDVSDASAIRKKHLHLDGPFSKLCCLFERKRWRRCLPNENSNLYNSCAESKTGHDKFKEIQLNTITIKCKVITPMFLGGANPQKPPEIRPPSIKGLLRYWWRAIQSPPEIQDSPDFRTLKEKEAKIFGAAGEEDKPKEKNIGRSPFNLIVRKNIKNAETFPYRPLPHHEVSTKKGFEKSAIKSEATFILELSRSNDIDLDYILNLLHISSLLGGLGNRSRRGFGSFMTEEIEKKLDESHYLDYILRLLNLINSKNEFEISNDKIIRTRALSLDYPYVKTVEVGHPYEDCDKLLYRIGDASSKAKRKYRGKSLGSAGNEGRLASPVYVSAIMVNGKLRPIITTLNATLQGEKVNEEHQEAFKNFILRGEPIDA